VSADESRLDALLRREALRQREVTLWRANAPGPSLPVHSKRMVDVLWTGICHPLALAVLEHRAPGGWWSSDPFSDRSDASAGSTVTWSAAVACMNGLAMPKASCEQGPQAGKGIDAGDVSQIAYWVDTVHDMPTIVEVPFALPETLGDLEGMPLHQLIELPPARADLAEACRALRIGTVHRDERYTALHLEPAPWVPTAPVPTWAANCPGTTWAFRDITIVN